MSLKEDKIKEWLTTFQANVQTQDFESGRKQFDKIFRCFGSYADEMLDLDDLIERQWKQMCCK